MLLAHADIFCRVIDNFGDAGVAWRLACQLAGEHSFSVRLFIDAPKDLAKIRPKTLTNAHPTVLHWDEANSVQPSALVLSTFCCRVPEVYIAAMRTAAQKPVWINVEYLSAEPWVETHHKLPSLRPDGLIEYFFYPGFTPKTGGLLRERDFHPAKTSVNPCFMTSVFAYETQSIEGLIAGMNDVGAPVQLWLPFGRLTEKMGLFAPQVQGCVTLEPIAFTDQAGYDALLSRSDFNIVRGEDSFVRAQWAAKPFLWHIYPQAENAHVAKLQAWLSLFDAHLSTTQLRNDVSNFFHAWNSHDATVVRALWPTLYAHRSAWQRGCEVWRERLTSQRDLATQLIEFANKLAYPLQ